MADICESILEDFEFEDCASMVKKESENETSELCDVTFEDSYRTVKLEHSGKANKNKKGESEDFTDYPNRTQKRIKLESSDKEPMLKTIKTEPQSPKTKINSRVTQKDLQKQIDDLTNRLNISKKSEEKLTMQVIERNDRLKAVVENEANKLKKLNNAITTVKLANSQFEENEKVIKKNIEDLGEENVNLKKVIKSFQKKQKEVEKMKSQFYKLQKERQNFEELQTKLKSEKLKLEQNVNDLKCTLKSKEHMREEMVRQKDIELYCQKSNFELRIDELKHKNERLENNKEELDSEIEALKSEKDESSERVFNLLRKIEKIEKQKDREISNSKTDYETLKNDKEGLDNEIQALKSERDLLDERVLNLLAKIEKIEKQSDREMSQLKAENSDLKERVQNLNALNLQEKIANIEAKSNTEIEALKKENMDLKSKLNSKNQMKTPGDPRTVR